ncbi:MAG: hypothetical protein LBH58_09025 [Tannerellaceae bacterium]|jgi:hypothetical protein|nr:hypothetical protein [Tannerellaceae bacterium]
MARTELREKIINHAGQGFYTEEQIKLLIDNDCECDCCGYNFFEYGNEPIIDIEKEEVLCRSCKYDLYGYQCPVCENFFDEDELSMLFMITEEESDSIGIPTGLYRIIKYPIHLLDEDAREKIAELSIEDAVNKDIETDRICRYCAEKYMKKLKHVQK